MSFFKSILRRRQFLLVSLTSAATMALSKVSRIFVPFSATASEEPQVPSTKKLKGIVVYYSATGSTGKIAGAIYRGMNSIIDCDVAPIKKVDPQRMAEYDVVAIGGPIWYYRETANLRLFIYKMPLMAGKPCILFCTHGTQPSGFFNSLMQPVRKKQFTVIGWNDWYGGASHVLHMPSPYVTDGHPDEIDLKEAEAFGRDMAERARRICAGEKNLVPDIPSGPDADPLWEKSEMSGGGGMPEPTVAGVGASAAGSAQGIISPDSLPGREQGGTPGPDAASGARGGRGPVGMIDTSNEIPKIDMTKCVYPRCTSCTDNCVANAIDFGRAVPAAFLSESPILVEGCVHCSQPMCERACAYDAITYRQMKTKHVYDPKKCIYPKCTLCIDNCPMESIDFSNPKQPVVHNNCEGCDLCWCICPYDAISIPNIAETHALLANSETRWDSPFLANLNEAEKTGRFRRLVPIDKVGWGNLVYKNPHAPRVVLHEENYPYHVNES